MIPASTPVVFLHAFPLNASMWSSQVAALGERATLTPDFPGFGGRPPSNASLDDFAQAVLDDMDEAGITKAVVVGLSMGGYVAFRLQALAPDRIAGMVLADTRPGADSEEGKAKRTAQAERVRQEGVGWMPEALLPALLGGTSLRERADVVRAATALMVSAHPEGVARALEAMRDRPDATARLPEILVPVLALVGEEDDLTPVDEARRIAEGVADGQLQVLPRSGHLSNLETPNAFNEALRSFFQDRASTSP